MDLSNLSRTLEKSKNIMEQADTIRRGSINLNKPSTNYPIHQTVNEDYNQGGGLFDDIPNLGINNNEYNNSHVESYSNPPTGRKQEIKNSLLKEIAENPIGDDTMDIDNGSVLDKIDLGNLGSGMKTAPNVPKYKLNEETTPPYQYPQYKPNYQVPQQQGSAVDYSLLKVIIEDAVKKSIAPIVKKIVNEINENKSNNDTMALMNIGSEFSFLTKNGNLYKAKPTFIKNVNKK